MSDVIRRIVDDDPNDEPEWSGTAVVTNAAAGATRDGRLLITVSWRGGTFNCAYLASYTPVVGHRVSFIKNGPSVFVLGKPATLT